MLHQEDTDDAPVVGWFLASRGDFGVLLSFALRLLVLQLREGEKCDTNDADRQKCQQKYNPSSRHTLTVIGETAAAKSLPPIRRSVKKVEILARTGNRPTVGPQAGSDVHLCPPSVRNSTVAFVFLHSSMIRNALLLEHPERQQHRAAATSHR